MFILMSRKTTKSYEHVFKYIKNHILDMNCKSITTDFERAMRKALRNLYPNVTYVNCWFHFCQAAKKRAMQTPQLIPYIRQNREAEELYYKLLSLPLLPACHIASQFRRLKVLALANHRAVFSDFLSYFESQWIVKVSIRTLICKL